ncbi:MAG: DUF1799 domain-containing protein [Burkholderia vietnamiensis]|nr:DUF1799 domain-containing protein [Burkholderia vietnamiensis]
MPEEEIDEALGSDEEQEQFEIWPENVAAIDAFLVCRRLWRLHPMGGALGLDRPNVETELRMRRINVNAALLDNLAAIEDGVLEVWNAKQ